MTWREPILVRVSVIPKLIWEATVYLPPRSVSTRFISLQVAPRRRFFQHLAHQVKHKSSLRGPPVPLVEYHSIALPSATPYQLVCLRTEGVIFFFHLSRVFHFRRVMSTCIAAWVFSLYRMWSAIRDLSTRGPRVACACVCVCGAKKSDL